MLQNMPSLPIALPSALLAQEHGPVTALFPVHSSCPPCESSAAPVACAAPFCQHGDGHVGAHGPASEEGSDFRYWSVFFLAYIPVGAYSFQLQEEPGCFGIWGYIKALYSGVC